MCKILSKVGGGLHTHDDVSISLASVVSTTMRKCPDQSLETLKGAVSYLNYELNG